MDLDEFEISLNFKKHTRDPARVFHSMASYIDSLTLLDSSLLLTFNATFETHLELEDVRSGSIKTILRRILNAVDDEALRAGEWKKIIGRFLHDAKYSVLKWCNDNNDITDPKQIDAQAKVINEMVEDTQAQFIPTYQPFSSKALINSVLGIVEAGKGLQCSEQVIYKSAEHEIEISRTVTFSPDILEHYLKPARERERQKAVVVIKKPDYLGDSQWELRLKSRTIRAHILDLDWLRSFRKRQFEIKPGDALRVILDVSFEQNMPGDLGEPRYDVVEVLGIVPGTGDNQQLLIE